MKVIRFENGPVSNRAEYTTNLDNIRDAAAEFGRSEDTIELYKDSGELVGVAIWPQGSKVYMYCYGELLDPNPSWRRYIY